MTTSAVAEGVEAMESAVRRNVLPDSMAFWCID
jgi:hypothetical protein